MEISLPSTRQQTAPVPWERHDEADTQRSQHRESFGDFLARTGRDPESRELGHWQDVSPDALENAHFVLGTGAPLEVGGRRLALTVEIGENAVAFSAQPLLTASAFEQKDLLVPDKGPDLQERSEGLDDRRVRNDNHQTSAEFFAQAPAHVLREGVTSRVHPLHTSDAFPARPAQRSSGYHKVTALTQPPFAAAAVSPERMAANRDQRQIRGSTASGAAVPREAHARAQLFAHLLASTSEYRVQIRGMRGESIDRIKLADAIRATLRGLGLPDLPVILAPSGNEA